MATKTIAWTTGSGNITLTYTGQGNGPISVASDENDSFDDRSQSFNIVTTNGSPEKAVSILVKQQGKKYAVGEVFNFGYTGSVQEVTLPKGKYKLQCWGAQGGSVTGTYAVAGSKGGYSEGVLTLTKTTTLYIFVGGKGTDYTSSSSQTSTTTINGGWNGGGAGRRTSRYNSGDTDGRSFPRGGGGATDISTVTSAMSYSGGRTTRDSASLLARCIVAGGGGGASARYTRKTIPGSTTIKTENISYTIEQGTWNESLGSPADWSSPYHGLRVRTNEGISCVGGDRYVISVSSGYQVFVILFSKYVSNTVGSTSNTVYTYYSWTRSRDITIPSGVVAFAIAIKNDAGSAISPSDSHGLKITHYYEVTGSSTVEETFDFSGNAQGGGVQGVGVYPGTKANGGANGGEFGLGASQTNTSYRYVSGGGGGGWYGGGKGQSNDYSDRINYNGGGSGWINVPSNASYRPSGFTGLELDDGSTTDGSTSFVAPSGGMETGHSGNGYARITVIE